MSKIYDCFLFLNELDILDIRLNLLNKVVDKFVIVESTVTFSGKPKKLIFEENKSLFKNFLHKIIHIVVDDTPTDFLNLNVPTNLTTELEIQQNKIFNYLINSNFWNKTEKQWGREIYQRESIVKGLISCNDHDMIIISDVDEIPNPLILENLDPTKIYELKQDMFYYNINTLKQKLWSGPKIASWNKLKSNSINELRQNKLTTLTINEGGWHLSFMGGKDRIVEKLNSYSHQEYNNNRIISNIENNIKNDSDIFFNPGKLSTINHLTYFPNDMIKIINEKYKYLLK
jgi:beta-1,4-mannosyl-glycoprotein beta-1,4-N-acetylglucosaminyltransferase